MRLSFLLLILSLTFAPNSFAIKMESKNMIMSTASEINTSLNAQGSSNKVSVTKEDIENYYDNLSGCIGCHSGTQNYGDGDGVSPWSSNFNLGANNCDDQLEALKTLSTNKSVWSGENMDQALISPGNPCVSRLYTVFRASESNCSQDIIESDAGWMGEGGYGDGSSADIIKEMIENWNNLKCSDDSNSSIKIDTKFSEMKSPFADKYKKEVTYTKGDQRTIDKMTVYHTLFEIFNQEAGENIELKNILKRNVLDKPFSFGSPCDLYNINVSGKYERHSFDDETDRVHSPDDGQTCIDFYGNCGDDPQTNHISGDFICYQPSHIQVPHNQVSNVIRAGLMQKACGKIIFPEFEGSENNDWSDLESNNQYVQAALEKACDDSSGCDELMTKMWIK